MPVQPTYPGVYIEELPSGVRTISGVATSITAFVGATARGLVNKAVRIFSFADFDRAFGGLAVNSELSYAVQQFFDNGGSDAYVVRVVKGDGEAAAIKLLDGSGADSLTLTAISKGAWGNGVVADVDYTGAATTKSFNLIVRDLVTGTTETFRQVTMDASQANFVKTIVNDPDNGSQMVRVTAVSANRPAETGTAGTGGINSADLQDLTKAFSLKITIDSDPLLANVAVDLLAINEQPRPKTPEAVALLVEQKVNPKLDDKVPGASITARVDSSGNNLRLQAVLPAARFPAASDAVVTLADSGAPALGFGSQKANVAQYRLGLGALKNQQGAAKLGTNGTGSGLPEAVDLIGKEADFSGIYALRKVDLFNILCIPDATRSDIPKAQSITVFSKALNLCLEKRAFLLVDPPVEVDTPGEASTFKTNDLTQLRSPNAAVYFPRVVAPDPLQKLAPRNFAPCGVVAGCFSRTDATRGVWKAPAGIDVSLRGVQSLAYKLTDAENGSLNILGVNCLRTFSAFGNVVWGARTLVGSNEEGSESKYVPVRRLTLFIEESLFRGTQFVVFEPNDETLWAQIRLNVGVFMNDLFRQGAFQGKSQRDAFVVRCDSTTTTQSDINNGIVNIIVGFAPLKPAEFVFIKIQQLAGQLAV